MFQRGTFCGSTVRGLSSQIGWGAGQASQMTIALVDDVSNGDFFTPLPIGTPAFFNYGNLSFYGLFQKYERKSATDGSPLFEVVLTDPREILDGVQVVIGAYRGPTSAVANLINAFGFWENIQFGLSGSNEAGMPWQRIQGALQNIANSPGGSDFGGPLQLNGISYGLDLSQLPIPSVDYRLGGTSISLMDAISQICEDGGCDFFVRLNGYNIQICTTSRRSQPPLGTIQAFVQAGNSQGNIVRSSTGLEFRNEVTSSFLVGGPLTNLFQTNSIRSFWGYDPEGFPIWGSPRDLELKDLNGRVLTAFQTEFMNLNASSVADILGNDRYLCSAFEMQCAKANYDTWALYMLNNRRGLATSTGLVSAFTGINPDVVGKTLMSDITDVSPEQAQLAAEDTFNNSNRLYEFVRGYADEYLGRKFAIGLPFVLTYQEDETFQIVSSYNIVDSGYLEEGASPLGMSEANEDQFRNSDGRFRCFVKYNNIEDLDLTAIQPQSSVIENQVLFAEATTDPQILFDDKPYALVTLSGVVAELPVECAGDPTQLGALLGTTAENFNEMSAQEFMPFAIAPAVISPDEVAIPLQSNLFTYGPWAASGAQGKVLFEQDTGLTPWDYGDYDTMNGAGAAKVTNAITNMQVSETGNVEQSGTPVISVGDVLVSGGPLCTNIEVAISTQGATTTYRFATYTPRYGVFNKNTGEKLKRLGLASQALRRSVRVSQRNLASKSVTKAIAAANKSKDFKESMPAYKKKKTPHGLIVAHNFFDTDGDGDAVVRGTMQSATHADAITLANPGSEEFQSTAIMSLNGLFRPFSTRADSPIFSSMETPDFDADEIPSLSSLNPFQDGHDIETFTFGDEFETLNGFRNQPDNSNARMFALRGPVVISGWGFGWNGDKFPSDDGGATFSEKHMRRQETWKTGPLDALWDDNRKVWTCHDIIVGKTADVLPAYGSGLMTVSVGDSTKEVWVKNHFGTAVSGDTNLIVGYSALDNSLYAIAGDCVPQDS